MSLGECFLGPWLSRLAGLTEAVPEWSGLLVWDTISTSCEAKEKGIARTALELTLLSDRIGAFVICDLRMC